MSWRLAKGERSSYVWKKKKKRRRKCDEIFKFLCVQESSMEGMFARIKHGKSVCKN
jgi:hypothetical protein